MTRLTTHPELTRRAGRLAQKMLGRPRCRRRRRRLRFRTRFAASSRRIGSSTGGSGLRCAAAFASSSCSCSACARSRILARNASAREGGCSGWSVTRRRQARARGGAARTVCAQARQASDPAVSGSPAHAEPASAAARAPQALRAAAAPPGGATLPRSRAPSERGEYRPRHGVCIRRSLKTATH